MKGPLEGVLLPVIESKYHGWGCGLISHFILVSVQRSLMNSTFSEAACPEVFGYFLSSLSESDQSGPFSAVFAVMFSIPRGGLTNRRPLECAYGMNEWMDYTTVKELLTSSSLIFLNSIKKLSLRLIGYLISSVFFILL